MSTRGPGRRIQSRRPPVTTSCSPPDSRTPRRDLAAGLPAPAQPATYDELRCDPRNREVFDE